MNFLYSRKLEENEMSWIAKAENLLNKIDQSAANVLQQREEILADNPAVIAQQIPKIPSSRNVMILSKVTPKKVTKNDEWETKSETNLSRRSSISSKHETVIDKSEDQKSAQLKESSSNASLNSFSVEKELSDTKILASELRSENNELKGELESLMEQVKVNGNAVKLQELENLCAVLMEEKKELTSMQVLEIFSFN